MNTLDTDISYLKGVGPKKAEMLNKELSIFNFHDLLHQFPHRYIDKTQFHSIGYCGKTAGKYSCAACCAA